jgi:hypothetical protein
VAHLVAISEIVDPVGMASTRLAEAVGYPGSSVAFAQLLSGMERDGLIVREVRGKRTYRITLPGGEPRGAPARFAPSRAPDSAEPNGPAGRPEAGRPEQAAAEFDYDELARRLLIQVVRRLAASHAERAGTGMPAPQDQGMFAALTAENAKLREQLRETQRSLDLARERIGRPPIAAELDRADVVLLERLLSASRDADDRGATAS